MTTIPESHRDLIESPLVASLSTVGTDGLPQVTAIWFVAVGDCVQISVLTERQKFKNVIARPLATLFVTDPENPFRTLEIRGTVTAGADPDLSIFQRVFRHYGTDPATMPAAQEARSTITLRPTHVIAQG